MSLTDTACISRINGHYLNDPENIYDSRDYIEVFPGYIQVRFGSPGQSVHPPPAPSPRGEITTFSPDSRRRLLKLYGSLADRPNLWFDLTFPDDVMAGLSVSERAALSYSIFRKFDKRLKRHRQLSEIWGIVRREWQPRKSGPLVGEEIPHMHVLAGGLNVSQKNYGRIARRILRIWVDCLGTNNENALKVAMHEKSYRYIHDAKMAFVYASKYTCKIEGHYRGSGSYGRFWFKLGKPPIAEPITLRTHLPESDMLRRIFRRLFRKSKRLSKSLSKRSVTTWFFCSITTTLKLLQFVSDATAPPF